MKLCMKQIFVILLLLVIISPMVVLSQTSNPSKEDHPMVQRYPGSEPMGTKPGYRGFDEFTLVLGKVKGDDSVEKSQQLEGKIYFGIYHNPEGRSVFEIYKNYETGLTKAGFKILYSCKDAECGSHGTISREVFFYDASYLRHFLAAKLSRPSGDVYVSLLVQAQDPSLAGDTRLHVIEMKPMETGLVKVNAAALADDITRTGHVAVYGIYFDTGKAEIKPESESTIKEIATLLQQNGQLKLHVIGHTDNVGDLAKNMDFSRRRAQSVMQALTVKHGVAAARLRADGVGPLAPVASNKSEDGRAQNRRVELVEQ